MKRLHIHLSVADLEQSIRFYSTLFGSKPAVQKPDYAKWMLDNPRVNFAISTRSATTGVDHLGIQAEDDAELQELYTRVADMEGAKHAQGETTCCYAQSEKTWITDPQGIPWETYRTMGEAAMFGKMKPADEQTAGQMTTSGACCAPRETVTLTRKSTCASTAN